MDLIDLVTNEDKRNKKEKETNIDLMNLERELKNNYFVYENKKLNKWNDLIKNLDQLIKEKSPYLKKLIRKGIPDCFRGYVWLTLGNIENYKQNSGINYKQMVEMNKDKNYEDYTAAEKEILKDLNRTFPNNTFFREKFGLGQRSMFNVLSCFSRYSLETGYVQGMGFLSACFLNFMDEESAFWMLISIMDKYQLKGFYKQGFPELSVALYKFMNLVKKMFPKIFESFKSKSVYSSMFASQWFLTLFIVNLKFEVVVRIFDCFLMEGMRVIYRMGLALLKLNEDKITSNKEFDVVMNIMKNLDEGITIDKLFKTAFESIKFTEKMLKEYELEYEALKMKEETNEIMELL